MPVVTGSLAPVGALTWMLVGVQESRRQALLRNGMPVPAAVRVASQIDTGSTFSAISLDVLRHLEIGPIERTAVRTPSTTGIPQEFGRYAVSLALEGEGADMYLPQVLVIETVFGPEEGIQAMLGRDVLEHCLFVYDGKARTFALAY
jgi:hypothetical protein